MKRKALVASALIGLVVAVPLSQAGAAPQATRTTSSVTLAGDGSAEVGTSTLTRTESGLVFTLETSGLEPGHAVTIWWMVTNPDGGVAVLYAAGHVVGGTGTATFSGYLAEGDTAGWVMGDDKALEDALTATVTLVVRDHGPGRADILNDQIRTFGACNPDCTDVQMSVHSPN
jgi:Cu/Zn superoxide dismutase